MARVFAGPSGAPATESCGASDDRELDGLGAAARGVQPAGAVFAHRLDDRDERKALVREAVLDARRDLGVGLALEDALLLQRAQAQRECAGADALERALELAEPRAALSQVADDQHRPLAADNLGGTADGTVAVGHLQPILVQSFTY